MKILFVCLGNICRSPIAHGVLEAMAKKEKLDWTIHSAGTNRHHKGGPADERSVRICGARGFDISHHIARRFKTADFSTYDVIYTFAREVVDEMEEFIANEEQRKKIMNFLDEMPQNSKWFGQDVPDPWYGGEDGFRECFDLIEACCKEILKKHATKKP